MRRRLLAVGAVVSAAVAVCCAQIAGVQNVVFVGPDAGPSDADLCEHAAVPAAPASGSPGEISFLAAVQRLDLTPDASADVGYDLDGVCTCQGGPESCLSLVPGDEHCDGPGGRDLSANASLGPYLEVLLKQLPSGDINDRIAKGILTYFIQVINYNGTPDDPNVIVGFYDSSGLYDIVDGGHIPPSWDGGDVWALDCNLSQAACPDADVIGDGGIAPYFVDTAAYVTGGTLVAHFNPLVIGLGITRFRVATPVLTAKIAPVGSGYGLTGQLLGRLSLHDLFVALAILPAPGGGNLCGDSGAFQAFKPLLCGSADIRADPTTDNTGMPCDAVSFSLPFVALPAQIGYRLDHVPIPQGCNGVVDDCDH